MLLLDQKFRNSLSAWRYLLSSFLELSAFSFYPDNSTPIIFQEMPVAWLAPNGLHDLRRHFPLTLFLRLHSPLSLASNGTAFRLFFLGGPFEFRRYPSSVSFFFPLYFLRIRQHVMVLCFFFWYVLQFISSTWNLLPQGRPCVSCKSRITDEQTSKQTNLQAPSVTLGT